MDRSSFIYPDSPREPFEHPSLPVIAERIRQANERGSAVVIACGGHVIKQGLNPLVVSLMEKGFLSHLAANGSVAIHDFELALVGASTESVARYVRTGEFGLWQETGRINDAVSQGYAGGLGFGESVGRMIEAEKFPFRDTSLLAAGVRLNIPVTVHIGIGYDIIHEHPNFDGRAAGGASYRDFLILAETLTRLQGGVFLNIGTSVMGPEVYLKALTMARNIAHQHGGRINEFTTAVFDLAALGENLHTEPPKTDPRYYFRPHKTILVRTVAGGGESFYVQGDHRRTIPALYDLLTGRKK
ncbi:MAG: hypothetical protein AB1715_03675 [Acidobacteriota bacterium]